MPECVTQFTTADRYFERRFEVEYGGQSGTGVANEISRVLIFPVASKIETFVKGRVELVEFMLRSGNRSLVTVWRRFIGNIRLRYLSAQYKEERKFIFRTESLFHRKAISFTLQHPIGRLSSSLNLWEIVRIRSEEF